MKEQVARRRERKMWTGEVAWAPPNRPARKGKETYHPTTAEKREEEGKKEEKQLVDLDRGMDGWGSRTKRTTSRVIIEAKMWESKRGGVGDAKRRWG